jgi:hypothetical protein
LWWTDSVKIFTITVYMKIKLLQNANIRTMTNIIILKHKLLKINNNDMLPINLVSRYKMQMPFEQKAETSVLGILWMKTEAHVNDICREMSNNSLTVETHNTGHSWIRDGV